MKIAQKILPQHNCDTKELDFSGMTYRSFLYVVSYGLPIRPPKVLLDFPNFLLTH